jgi:hypothetical protein
MGLRGKSVPVIVEPVRLPAPAVPPAERPAPPEPRPAPEPPPA